MTAQPYKILRIRRDGRYIVLLQLDERTIATTPYWTAEQALAACKIPPEIWDLIPMEIYAEIFSKDLPSGFVAFSRESRRGTAMTGTIVWGPKGILPTHFPSFADAIAEVGASGEIRLLS